MVRECVTPAQVRAQVWPGLACFAPTDPTRAGSSVEGPCTPAHRPHCPQLLSPLGPSFRSPVGTPTSERSCGHRKPHFLVTSGCPSAQEPPAGFGFLHLEELKADNVEATLPQPHERHEGLSGLVGLSAQQREAPPYCRAPALRDLPTSLGVVTPPSCPVPGHPTPPTHLL